MPLVQFNCSCNYWETNKTYKKGEIIEVDSDQFKELTSKGVATAYIEPPKTEKEVLEGTSWVCFKKSINGFKCGEIVELDANEARDYKEKGIAVAATTKPMVIEEVVYPEGKQKVQFLKTTIEYRMNDIVELDNQIAIPLIENGIAITYVEPPKEIKEIEEGKQKVQFLKTTEEHKINEVIELDNKIAIPLIEKGIAVAYVAPRKEEKEILKGKDTICFKKSVNSFKSGEIVELDANAARDYKEQGFAMVAEKENEKTLLLKSIYKMNREELLEFANERKINVFPYQSENLVRRLIIIALERGE